MITNVNELDLKIESAHAAYEAARNVAPEERANWLSAIARNLEDHASELVALAAKETHLAEPRLRGELARTTFQLRLFASEIANGDHFSATVDHKDDGWGMGPRPDIRRVNVPLGVVGVFGASNFPFAFSVMGGDSASALAAGCAVVHKVHEGHFQLGLRTSQIVVQALASVSAPSGLFSAVSGREAGERLVDHPLIKAIGFTGSTSGGRALFDRACRRPEPIPFFGELGSINPVFVTEKAWTLRRDIILSEYVDSFTLSMGQFCTKPGILFAPTADRGELLEVLRRSLDGKSSAPLLNERLREGFDKSFSKVSTMAGVTTLIPGGGKSVSLPAVLITTTDMIRRRPKLLREEMFGPATLIVQYERGENLVHLAEMFEGQLTSSVHAEPDEDLTDLVGVLRDRSGRLLWNAWPTGVTVTYAQHHGGPYPATTASGATAVGTAAIGRFMRPVAFDSFPASHLPPALKDDNPWGIRRRVDGRWVNPTETHGVTE